MKIKNISYLIFIIFILFLFSIGINNLNKENYDNNLYQDSVIPKYFFQIWINNENKIPKLIEENFNSIKYENQDFECKLYKKDDCLDFLQKNYEEDVINAYNKIIPGAYKADLMRYCILYKKGGIYLDAKLKPINDFKLNHVTDKEYYVKDFKFMGGGVTNGFMVCKKNNPKLLKAINEIVKNVKEKYYGKNSLSPTGPLLLKKVFSEEEINNFDFEYTTYSNGSDNKLIISKKPNSYESAIFEKAEDLVEEQTKSRSEKNYGELWNEKKIYEPFQNIFNSNITLFNL
jgi:mannosyltransferase OCH1-like enzyme